MKEQARKENGRKLKSKLSKQDFVSIFLEISVYKQKKMGKHPLNLKLLSACKTTLGKGPSAGICTNLLRTE